MQGTVKQRKEKAAKHSKKGQRAGQQHANARSIVPNALKGYSLDVADHADDQAKQNEMSVQFGGSEKSPQKKRKLEATSQISVDDKPAGGSPIGIEMAVIVFI